MPRIPESDLERLKREVSVQRLVEAAGVKLAKRGVDLVGRCPFHDDRTPSLVVSPKKNLWHCLGACQTGGSAIDWVMKARGVSFRHAVELLRAQLDGTLPEPATANSEPGRLVKTSSVRALPSPLAGEADDRELLGRVVAYYHETLKRSPEAQAYLAQRGLASAELIEHFQLGYADRSLAYRMPERSRVAGASLREQLQRLGVLRDSGHEHLRGSLIVPIHDETGGVVGMYGRKVGRTLRPGTPLHLYLPGPHRAVWNIDALRASREVIWCEALIDAMTFWAAGLRNVTTSYGVEGFLPMHLEALRAHRTERVYIAYDRDDAGDRAAEALAKRLMTEGIECFRVLFPRGMDANAYAQSVTPADKSLELLVRSAQWLGKGPSPVRTQVAAATTAETAAEGAAPSSAAELPPPAAAASTSAPATVEAERPAVHVEGERVYVTRGERVYRATALDKGASVGVMRVSLQCVRQGAVAPFVDAVDLCAHRQRVAYAKAASVELCAEESEIKDDLGHVLAELERLRDEKLAKAITPKQKTVALTDAEREAALELLRDPRLCERILEDFERCGMVGEQTNKLVGYIASVSRKLDAPLAVIIQSSSAAGKSSLMEAVLALVPEEDRIKYSAMTGQSLFYMGESDLKHKVLAIVEEEGAERASYALKLLQSEGELTIASTGKDPQTGELVTRDYRVEGPVMIFLTTTAVEIDEELLNRCVVLTVDEERAQTQAIHRLQRRRETLEGLLRGHERRDILSLHRNAQRLLRAVAVVNPHAERLSFMDDRTRTRRDHMKYLTLIRTVTLLHQYQRATERVEHRGRTIEYISTTLEDIAIANRLAHAVLGRSLDELPPQTRRLLLHLEAYVSATCARQKVARRDFRFTRREVREGTGWGNSQLKVHLGRLVDHEYMLMHRGPRGGFVYELAYDGGGKDGTPYLPGLIDVAALGYDDTRPGSAAARPGQNEKRPGSGRGSAGARPGGGRGEDSSVSTNEDGVGIDTESRSPKNIDPAGSRNSKSYSRNGTVPAGAVR